MSSSRGLVRALIAVGLSWMLLFGSISLAMAVPGLEFLQGFGDGGRLDYSHRSGFFAPLTRGFIARILGLEIPNSSESRTSSRGRSASSSGGRTLVEHLFNNDDFVDAYPIPSIPFTAKTQTSRATRQPGEPDGCAPVGGTVWYRYRPGTDVGLVADTLGTNYSTAVAVFTGPDLHSLSSVRCDADARGNAQVVFPARGGTTYFFQITGLISGGDLVFNLDPLGITSRVSVSSGGAQSEATSRVPEISGDGRYAVFGSWSNGLVPDDNNFMYDVFVHDRANRNTSRVSVNSSGEPGNDHSWMGAISTEGRHVAFVSYASNLVPGDTNGQADIFVHDRLVGSTTRVSVASGGNQGSAPPFYGGRECYSCFHEDTKGDRPYLQWLPLSISGDGRYVAFDSDFDNLVPNDSNLRGDVFVHDRASGTTVRASVSSSGAQANGFSFDAQISDDGRFVAFASLASNLVVGDTNDVADVFVHDLQTGTTSRVSTSIDGGNGDGASTRPALSAEGRFIAYVSNATNLVSGDTNGLQDVFVQDRFTGVTTRVSVSSTGEEQLHTGQQFGPDTLLLAADIECDISADGRQVVFYSSATNLVPGDTNGLGDVFVRDIATATTTRVSVSSAGDQADGSSGHPRLSSDGRQVIFSSGASNLVSDDSNKREDIFVHEFSILR